MVFIVTAPEIRDRADEAQLRLALLRPAGAGNRLSLFGGMAESHALIRFVLPLFVSGRAFRRAAQRPEIRDRADEAQLRLALLRPAGAGNKLSRLTAWLKAMP